MKIANLLRAVAWLDIASLTWLLACWIGYARYHMAWSHKVPTLMDMTHKFRREWMRQLLRRDNRMVDASILNGLANSSTFFASTSLVVLGGLLALLGKEEQLIELVTELHFPINISQTLWSIKILFLIMIFVYAFFKFSWSFRQFNFCSIMVGAAPQPDVQEDIEPFIARAARITVSITGFAPITSPLRHSHGLCIRLR